jgi:hypothetical protein
MSENFYTYRMYEFCVLVSIQKLGNWGRGNLLWWFGGRRWWWGYNLSGLLYIVVFLIIFRRKKTIHQLRREINNADCW